MVKKRGLWIYVISALLVALVAYAVTADKKGKTTGGEMAYTLIDIDSATFAEMYSGSFREWYDEFNEHEGVHSFSYGDTTYVLVCAGEKPSGGYLVDNIVLEKGNDEIRVMAIIKVPTGEVTDQLTYPHQLLAIPKESKNIVVGFFDTVIESELEEKTDSGTYVRRIEPDLIEVRISGVPESIPPRVFRLYEEVDENFDELGLQQGDQIRFIYSKNINQEDVITELKKLN
jgi:hypothetical protein